MAKSSFSEVIYTIKAQINELFGGLCIEEPNPSGELWKTCSSRWVMRGVESDTAVICHFFFFKVFQVSEFQEVFSQL